ERASFREGARLRALLGARRQEPARPRPPTPGAAAAGVAGGGVRRTTTQGPGDPARRSPGVPPEGRAPVRVSPGLILSERSQHDGGKELPGGRKEGADDHKRAERLPRLAPAGVGLSRREGSSRAWPRRGTAAR